LALAGTANRFAIKKEKKKGKKQTKERKKVRKKERKKERKTERNKQGVCCVLSTLFQEIGLRLEEIRLFLKERRLFVEYTVLFLGSISLSFIRFHLSGCWHEAFEQLQCVCVCVCMCEKEILYVLVQSSIVAYL